MPIARLFLIIAQVISLYTLLCTIRVLLTWFPRAQYTAFGRILASLCDPYLNLFRRLRFLRISMFDLSPAVALCVLIAVSHVLGNLAAARSFTLGGLLATVLYLLQSIVFSVFGFLMLLLVIRLVVLLLRKDRYGSLWDSLDHSLSPIVFRMTAPFTRGRPTSYKTALIVAIVATIVLMIMLRIVMAMLIVFCHRLPI
ncbi:MAG: YggT family protein [Treponemataceae bacterium]|nr:YggT family protein [Treponemataceae bacterium]MDE7391223.1 YggT family protein [Treponemataceae bacterium]